MYRNALDLLLWFRFSNFVQFSLHCVTNSSAALWALDRFVHISIYRSVWQRLVSALFDIEARYWSNGAAVGTVNRGWAPVTPENH